MYKVWLWNKQNGFIAPYLHCWSPNYVLVTTETYPSHVPQYALLHWQCQLIVFMLLHQCSVKHLLIVFWNLLQSYLLRSWVMCEHQISFQMEENCQHALRFFKWGIWIRPLSSKTCVSEWHKTFSERRKYVKANKWPGCPVMIKTEENVICGASCEKRSLLTHQSNSKGVE
jgi:hypothetical protein